jgi:hypothetical protein
MWDCDEGGGMFGGEIVRKIEKMDKQMIESEKK